jgi:hypothetical protein
MGYSKFGNSKTKSKNGKGLRQSKRFTKRNKNKKPRNLKKEPFYGGVVGSDSNNINTPLSESIYKPNVEQNIVPVPEPEVKQEQDSVPEPEVKQEQDSVPEPEVKQEQDSVPEPKVKQEQDSVPEPEVKQEQDSVPEPEVKQEQDSVHEPEVKQEQDSVPEPEVKQEQDSVPEPEVKQEPDVEVKQEQEQDSVPEPMPEVNQEQDSVPEPIPNVKQSNMKIESINPYKNEEELLNSNVSTELETQNINNVKSSVIPVPIIPESNNKAIDLNSIVDSIVDVIADKILKKINTSNNLDKTSAEKLNTTLKAIESRSKDISQQGAGYKKTIKKKKLKYVYNPRTKTLRRKR